MYQVRSERFAPQHGVAAIARMAEIEGVGHLRNKLSDQIWIPAIAIAGENQCFAADPFSRAVTAQHLYAADTAVGLRQQPLGHAFGQENDIICLRGIAQPVDQFPTRA